MASYTSVTNGELAILAALLGLPAPAYAGPALPRPEGIDGLKEVIATVDRLLADAQYLIQMQDGMSIPYTLNGVTATAERFMLGPETGVEQAAALRDLLVNIEAFFARLGLTDHATAAPSLPAAVRPHIDGVAARIDGWIAALAGRERPAPAPRGGGLAVVEPPSPTADYSAYALESVEQFAMAYTTFEDVYRHGYPGVEGYARSVTDRAEATRTFWPTLSANALPYNLLVLRRLDGSTIEPYRTAFGAHWTAEFDALLAGGRLYGIDMTIFAGLAPQRLPNGTLRSTPSTMALLAMDEGKRLAPRAVSVADPMDPARAEVYTEASGAWIYALMAVKTSLTVHGIWIGHVYTLHVVTAAAQMATWNELGPGHVVYQALAPQSHFTIPFDLVLLIGWPRLSPPTSISDFGKFLDLCSKFAGRRDFFSTDPLEALAALNLDAELFTSPGGTPWDLYPNVPKMLRVWAQTETYARAVVEAGYAADADVLGDAALQRWIAAAGAPGGGNIVGLPVLDGKAALTRVLTSLLYRVNFHAMGRLRSMGTPEPSFAPNFPPCLQSTRIPGAGEAVSTAELLEEFLPRTGTLGALMTFYGIFAFTAPMVSMVPQRGAGTEPFFAGPHAEGGNAALARLQADIEAFVAELQPNWIQTGQWPRNIEL